MNKKGHLSEVFDIISDSDFAVYAYPTSLVFVLGFDVLVMITVGMVDLGIMLFGRMSPLVVIVSGLSTTLLAFSLVMSLSVLVLFEDVKTFEPLRRSLRLGVVLLLVLLAVACFDIYISYLACCLLPSVVLLKPATAFLSVSALSWYVQVVLERLVVKVQRE